MSNMNKIRKAAVAGMFYPENKDELKSMLATLLDSARIDETFENICGIVSPHAGYVYSGFSAAHAYNAIRNSEFETAVILSPSHREYFQGLSIYSGDAYETPLGLVEIDTDLRRRLVNSNPVFFEGIQGHGPEHAVEVQLPFLQMIKSEFKIVPIVIGDQQKQFLDSLTEGLNRINDKKVTIIVSSDLSHFYSRQEANKLDSIVESHLLNMDYDGLRNDLESQRCEACGGGGIVSLLKLAGLNGFKNVKVLSRTDSGEASGDFSSVVGYLSAVIYN